MTVRSHFCVLLSEMKNPLFHFHFMPVCRQVCVESDWPVPDCRGGLSSLSPLPSFQSVAVLVGVSLWAVWTSVLCLCLFRFCSAATVYKICAWLQLTAGQLLVLLILVTITAVRY